MPNGLTLQLPIGRPLARGYQFYGFPLAILATDPRTTDWVLSNFIQVEYDKAGWDADVPFTFYLYDSAMSPWLEVVRGTRAWYTSSNIRELLRDGLRKGYYAHLVVDEFHIPHRRFHQLHRQPHDILVHGIDDETGTFTVLGYNDRMQFVSTQVQQADFEAGHTALDGLDLDNAPIFFYRLRTQPDFGYPPVAYDLNRELIRQTIDEYLRSADTSRHFQALRQVRPCVYGMATYAHLEEYIRLFARRAVRFDINHLHILWEHKALMTTRIDRLQDVVGPLPELATEAKHVESIAGRLRNGMLRDELQGGRPGYLDAALRQLEDLQQAEVALLSRLVDRLGPVER